MSALTVGLVCGVVFGALSAAAMAPLPFPDKRAALTAAFLNRLAIGICIGAAIGSPQVIALHVPAWGVGMGLGIVGGRGDAVITKAYAPIMVIGAIGGAVIGWIVGR